MAYVIGLLVWTVIGVLYFLYDYFYGGVKNEPWWVWVIGAPVLLIAYLVGVCLAIYDWIRYDAGK